MPVFDQIAGTCLKTVKFKIGCSILHIFPARTQMTCTELSCQITWEHFPQSWYVQFLNNPDWSESNKSAFSMWCNNSRLFFLSYLFMLHITFGKFCWAMKRTGNCKNANTCTCCTCFCFVGSPGSHDTWDIFIEKLFPEEAE